MAYVGTVTLLLKRPGATTVESIAIACGAGGAWSYDVYADVSGIWQYCVRTSGSVHGASFDQRFLVEPTELGNPQ